MVNIETPFKREEVIRFLQDNEYSRIFFYKINGDLREMTCTLNWEQLSRLAREPGTEFLFAQSIEEVDSKDRDPNQVRVFDTEIKAWRSFLLTNLITIESINQ